MWSKRNAGPVNTLWSTPLCSPFMVISRNKVPNGVIYGYRETLVGDGIYALYALSCISVGFLGTITCDCSN